RAGPLGSRRRVVPAPRRRKDRAGPAGQPERLVPGRPGGAARGGRVSMIQKKICMLGAFAVGKTSLVSRYVRSIFSDKYHSSVGVKVDKKLVVMGDEQLDLLLWDLYGEDEFQKIRPTYLRGSSGYVLVADGTRRETLEKAVGLQ